MRIGIARIDGLENFQRRRSMESRYYLPYVEDDRVRVKELQGKKSVLLDAWKAPLV